MVQVEDAQADGLVPGFFIALQTAVAEQCKLTSSGTGSKKLTVEPIIGWIFFAKAGRW